MSYEKWFNAHAKKHEVIVKKLVAKQFNRQEVINYFRWDNLKDAEPDFCPLFKENKKCHDIKNLHCYLCACPNFRFNDHAVKEKSYCSIDSKDGKKFYSGDIIHQDCSSCGVPHQKKYVKQQFDHNWMQIMHHCNENH
jgi:hypothetical protein